MEEEKDGGVQDEELPLNSQYGIYQPQAGSVPPGHCNLRSEV